MHFVSFLVHIVVDDMVHKKQDIFTYYCADINSPGTPEQGSQSFCVRMGLVAPWSVRFLPQVEGLKQFCAEKISHLRSDDTKVSPIMDELEHLI
jgi:hypothetical protein